MVSDRPRAAPRRSQQLPYRKLGQRLAELRKQTKMTQRELARVIDVSENYLPGLERGRFRPRIEVIERWAAATGGNVEELNLLAGYISEHHVSEWVPPPDKSGYLRELASYPTSALAIATRLMRAMFGGNDPLAESLLNDVAAEANEPATDETTPASQRSRARRGGRSTPRQELST